MLNENLILFTGGNGLLGKELKKEFVNSYFPTHEEFDVTNYAQMDSFLKGKYLKTIFHAAAFTSPPKIEDDPSKAIKTNIMGTSNIVNLCSKNDLKLIYISTDYVFRGDEGNYSEEDSVFPVNKYAWSKLGGECAVKLHDNSLIIRTSFGENEFPYEKAFTDQYTSRITVSNLVKKLIPILCSDLRGTIHIGSKRRSVMEYAKSISPEKEIGDLSINDLKFDLPKDTSLFCEKHNKLFGGKE